MRKHNLSLFKGILLLHSISVHRDRTDQFHYTTLRQLADDQPQKLSIYYPSNHQFHQLPVWGRVKIGTDIHVTHLGPKNGTSPFVVMVTIN